ncbi:MAG: nucleotide exchange factor GrpE [Methylobacter sp.]|jgi:molecular chaperone GrpE|uniref:nucleotide exchange factor GrpE n=1 Tax=Methylobacter sp. TaxID=2051955 RepID=UPI0025FC908E|nr:nucleotide exchange factor GrpE [Methylobacter sp.]MCK9622834.1 nucleotide exchange factor GrpE [Methylobacter sp.]
MSTDQEAPESQVKTENETVVEPPHTEVAEHEPTVEELQQALAQAEQKAQENWDKAVRAQAEMENLKRRTQKDLEDAHKFALTGFAKELLPVLDSLVLGLQAATGDSEEVKKFREGSELTIKQFESVFAKFKIETIDPIGQPFNAEQHQAMTMQAVEGVEPNTVVNVFQKGYMLNGRLLRPAMVVVAKAAENKPTDTPSIDEQA